jgi:G:T/U-mismatch repair DNA glycosylase
MNQFWKAYEAALFNARSLQAQGEYDKAALWFRQARRMQLAAEGR